MDPKLVAIIEDYARTHGLNLPPHQIMSDMVAAGPSGVEQLLAMLGVSINAGDPADNAQAQAGQAERDARLTDAQTKFPANEEQSAAQMAGVGSRDPMSQMSGLTQAASGIGQSLTGALGGALQPFTQLGQQVPQAGMQAMQAGMGALRGAGGGAAAGGGLLGAGGGLGGGAAELAGSGGGAAGTVPSAQLGPPPAPSTNTVPASSTSTSPTAPDSSEQARGPRGGMSGMPMVPPGGMQGAGAAGSNPKADAKRVVPPSVKNGAPVQGRISAPPAIPEVIKRVEGKPVATRRIIAPDQKPDTDSADQGG